MHVQCFFALSSEHSRCGMCARHFETRSRNLLGKVRKEGRQEGRNITPNLALFEVVQACARELTAIQKSCFKTRLRPLDPITQELFQSGFVI